MRLIFASVRRARNRWTDPKVAIPNWFSARGQLHPAARAGARLVPISPARCLETCFAIAEPRERCLLGCCWKKTKVARALAQQRLAPGFVPLLGRAGL